MLKPLVLLMAVTLTFAPPAAADDSFDHTYGDFGRLLAAHVRADRVDYAALQANRATLDHIVAAFGAVPRATEAAWPRPQRLAYWINAYNLFTLRAIIDHYPIRGSWLSLYPKNSIRQIDGVWTDLRWHAAGRIITLDDIEHTLLRPEFQDPRMHFAINCASIGCPPLAVDPYRADRLDAQLDAAAVRYLASPRGLVIDGGTLRLSSVFKWFGSDFTGRFAAAGPQGRSAADRALLAVVAAFGPPAARAAAAQPRARLAYLDYDWTLNDTATVRPR